MHDALLQPFAHLPWISAAVFFVFGACVGSFLNVLICRLPWGLSLLHPPSSCPRCGKRIAGLDNLPILSWLLLRGRCRLCRAPIHWRYPAVELLIALLWAAAAWQYATWADATPHGLAEGVALLVSRLIFLSALVTATMIDIDFRIIPDEISLGGLAVALTLSAAFPLLHLPGHPEIAGAFPGVPAPLVGLLSSLAGALAGGGALLAVTLLGTLAFRARLEKIRQTEDPEATTAIGLGDVKLMAFAGAFLGWKAVLASFFVGTVAGAVLGVADKMVKGRWPAEGEEITAEFAMERAFLQFAPLPLSVRRALVCRWQTGESLMPYGPALCIGLAFLLFFREPTLRFFGQIFCPPVCGL